MNDKPNIALRAYQLCYAVGRLDDRSDGFHYAAEEELRLQSKSKLHLIRAVTFPRYVWTGKNEAKTNDFVTSTALDGWNLPDCAASALGDILVGFAVARRGRP